MNHAKHSDDGTAVIKEKEQAVKGNQSCYPQWYGTNDSPQQGKEAFAATVLHGNIGGSNDDPKQKQGNSHTQNNLSDKFSKINGESSGTIGYRVFQGMVLVSSPMIKSDIK